MAITDLDVFTHLTDADIENLAVELDAIRQDDRRLPRRARCPLHPPHHRRAARAGGRRPGAAGGQLAPVGLVGGNIDPRRGQDRREHGDRPQRHARPVGLDERPRNSLLGVGVGHERVVQDTGATPTTSCTTSTPTSSAWTTTSATACCGLPATSPGSASTCSICCTTRCLHSASNGASACSTWKSAGSPRSAWTTTKPGSGSRSSWPRPVARWSRTTLPSRR